MGTSFYRKVLGQGCMPGSGLVGELEEGTPHLTSSKASTALLSPIPNFPISPGPQPPLQNTLEDSLEEAAGLCPLTRQWC